MKQSSTIRYRVLLVAALALLAVGPFRGAAEVVNGQVVAFERFLRASRPVCLQQPADACVAIAWRFTDEDGDQGLSLAELASVRTALEQWAVRHQEDLARPERSGIALGLLVVDSVGLERLHAIYDTDQDGLISRRELLADVRLDQRPLGQVLLDPSAVDHHAIARRLGIPPVVIDNALPK